MDSAGNVYVADTYNNTIRKVTPAGIVTTLAGSAFFFLGSADGTGSDARFTHPVGVAADSAGNVYVDDGDHTIRKVTPAGVVTTLAGLAGNPGSVDGTGSDARFYGPSGVAVDRAGNVYVADYGNHTIRKMTPAGVVTTLAGLAGSQGSADGTGSEARFSGPSGVAVDSAGNVYVADSGNQTIRKVTPTGVVTTLAGLAGNTGSGSADGTGSTARFNSPYGVAVDSAGNVYVADTDNNTIRKMTPAGVVTTLAGLAQFVFGMPRGGYADGIGSAARFNRPFGVAVDGVGSVYVADYANSALRKVTPAGEVTTLARGAGGNGVTVDSVGNIYVADPGSSTIKKVTLTGVLTTLTGAGCCLNPYGVAVDSAGNVYVADTGSYTIRKGYPAFMTLSSGPGFGFNVGQFGFNLTGPAGRLVVVEGSPDLVSWLPIRTNTFAGALNFGDPRRSISSNRFYRARLP